jgi:hypothetical protein
MSSRRTYKRIKTIIDDNRTFLSISTAGLSAFAAWAGYTSRLRHQASLEREIKEITERLGGGDDHGHKERLREVCQSEGCIYLLFNPTFCANA